MSKKLKVGDKVKIISRRSSSSQEFAGKKTIITSVHVSPASEGGFYYHCKTDNGDGETLLDIQPEDKKTERKDMPLFSGVLKYFPDALLYVSQVSKAGNDQHNKGEPLHWNREKSTDELDALARHLIDAGTVDTDGILHSGKIAWRALANLQKELEKNGNDIRAEKECPTT